MTAYEKLLNIQYELKAPKSQYNSFGKYNYRSCEDILEAAKPLCKKHRLALTLTDNVVNVGDRYYVVATATAIDIDDPASKISVTAFAREEEVKKGMDSSQVTGATSSYARKYALNGLFDIDDTKDADTGVNEPKPPKKPKTEADVDPEVRKVIEKIKVLIDSKLENGVAQDEIVAVLKKACGTSRYTKFTEIDKANAALEALNNM